VTKPEQSAPDSADAAGGEDGLVHHRRERVLKLVTRAFFNELTKYGIKQDEILRVASHLLDHVLARENRSPADAGGTTAVPFTTDTVLDEWQAHRRLTLNGVMLRPFEATLLSRVADWLRQPAIRDGFVPPYPESESALQAYFSRPDHDYFVIYYEGAPVGIIGGENIDSASSKLEMKKLIGEADLRGKGIGKRATFLFLYYAFAIAGVHKVYVHSRNTNVRNINLNSGFGFELEGALLEDAVVGGRRVDLVRMALLAPIWKAMFAPPDQMR
jgi:RimJ/RimL family protein N-acetyltransferase